MALPFPIEIRPGQPIYEQIVYAVKRAVARGSLQPGDRFPSVRALSQALSVNPNTVQKAVAELTSQSVLEVHSGQGCFVAQAEALAKGDGVRELAPLLERIVVEASRLGLSEGELRKALLATWERLKGE
jgi:DNA-binding transcriptional regulator YhcF (GntR family)